MDAGIMDGSTLIFGAVGAMPGIKNPILVAKLLVEEQQKGMLPLGRVPPGFLVGEGARDWAVRHGMKAVSTESLISDKAGKLFRHYKKKLDNFRLSLAGSHHQTLNPAVTHKRKPEEPPGVPNQKRYHPLDDRVTDTVGVVVLDTNGEVASTVSSGGIALKQPGRVGQASCFGCGCWAQNQTGTSGASIGVSTTGCGEHLVRTFLARECAMHLGSEEHVSLDSLSTCMKVKFVESEFLAGVPEKLGGAIVMCYDPEKGHGDFLWTHTTASMGIAYQTTADSEAKTRMSRLTKTAASNSCRIMVEGVQFSTVTKEDSPVSSSEYEVPLRPRVAEIPMQIDPNAGDNGATPLVAHQQSGPPAQPPPAIEGQKA